MKNNIYLLLIAFAAMFAAPMVVADEAAPTAPVAPEQVIVPYDVSKPVDSQKPAQVYISHERFLQLWEAAKANKRGEQPEVQPQSYVLSNSRYDAKLNDGALHVSGVIEVQTFNEGWVSVPLAFREARLSVLKLDGATASLSGNALAIDKPGHHRIEVEFDIPVGSNKKHLSWGIPQTAGTLFSITLPDKQMKASIQPGDGVVERIEGDQKIVTAALGSTGSVDLTLDSSVGLSTIKQAALAKIDTVLSITPAVELAHSTFAFSFPEGQQDHFTVTLDKALSLVKIGAPNLKSWKLTVGNDSQTLDIALTEPARESYTFSIDAERSLTDQQRRFPFISAAANRVEQTSALFTTPFLDITPQPSTALHQVSYPADQGNGLRLVAAFSSTGDRELLAYGVLPAKPSNKATISYVYLVNHSKIELVAALKLRIKNATLFDITLGLPGDFTVQAVESDRLKDWWLEGNVLHARFKGNAPDAETPLIVHLIKLYKTVPDALEITPLTLPDTWDVEGNGIIAASTAVQPQMTLAEAKEINPQNAATDFRILPPMERKLGFSFTGQKFHAGVKLATLPPRVNGTWVMSALAHESWVSVSTHVNLSARQGSAAGVSFRLPASTPEARITGDNVRETTSAVDGAWRVYQVAFQNDLSDKTDFTVDFDLPGDGDVSLPSFEFIGLERTEGFVIVDNASEYEMQVTPSGLDVALSEQIPFLPQVSRNASLYRALPGWGLKINLTRLEKEAGRSAIVEWAELATAIRTDGSQWHRALYHLQNRSLQFLPVKLPDGSDLASVSVAGENVRADKGQVDGKDVLLVPLIKTKPGDASYDVILVYRNTKAGGLWTISSESLADPEVVGITVERTLWNLYVPPGSTAARFSGNMDRVLDEVNETEKLRGSLDELRRLNNIVYNARDAETAQNAESNFRALAKSLDERAKAPALSPRMVVKGDMELTGENKDVAVQKLEIQKELADEEKSNTGNLNRAEHETHGTQPQFGIQKSKPVGANQSWADNGSYKSADKAADDAAKATQIDQQKAQGNQLYVNDYVVNVTTGANTYTGSTMVNGGVLSTNTGANGFSGGTVIAAQGGAANGTLDVNGNETTISALTLNGGAGSGAMVQNKVSEIQNAQALTRRGMQPPANGPVSQTATGFTTLGGGQITSGLRSGGEAVSSSAVDSLLNPGVPSSATAAIPAAPAAPPSQQSVGGNGNITILGAARANSQLNSAASSDQDQNLAEAQQALQSDAADANAASGEGDGAGEGQGQLEDAAAKPLAMAKKRNDGKSAQANLAITYSGGDTVTSSSVSGAQINPAAPAQLQAAGAISLPVDFPTDGLQVYHFKKSKSDARLSFWITNSEGLDKWKWLAVFGFVAVVLLVVGKLADRGYFRILGRRVLHI